MAESTSSRDGAVAGPPSTASCPRISGRQVIADGLPAYFRSGWAFLIPYLTAYLLYLLFHWPVNPPRGGHYSLGALLLPPSLLDIYWVLHGVNVILAAVAGVAWWRGRPPAGPATQNPGRSTVPRSGGGPGAAADPRDRLGNSPRTSALPALTLIPWVLLGLLFWIPGVFLEYPSDPWEHYRRINEWSALSYIGDFTSLGKFSYFLLYSLVGWIAPPTRQLAGLELCFTGCCLLLGWQYYRLARTVGLGERTAFVFVVIQALTAGNNVFGFDRYYGISSSIMAQIGAVGLVRIALEIAHRVGGSTATEPDGGPATAAPAFAAGRNLVDPLSRLIRAAGSILALVVLIAFNHIQGLGIAGMGLGAVVVWRLINWRRAMIWWLAGAAIVLSVVTVLWWPRNPVLDALYRPQGWLTAWYGFNLLSPHSPSFDRAVQILGIWAVFDLAAGLLLLRHNHVAGWLTLFPLVALVLPCVAIPFANSLLSHEANLLTFHRLLLAIPGGLAMVCAGRHLSGRWPAAPPARTSGVGLHPDRGSRGTFLASWFAGPNRFWVLLASLAALAAVPATDPYYNRLWGALVVPPDDLTMRGILDRAGWYSAAAPRGAAAVPVFATPGVSMVADATGVHDVPFSDRPIGKPVVSQRADLLEYVRGAVRVRRAATLLVPLPAALSTPASWSGRLSGHWLPQEVAMAYAAAPEIDAVARELGGKAMGTDFARWYRFPPESAAPPARP